MSRIHVTGDAVEIHLSLAEKIGALHGDLRVPPQAIRAAAAEDGLAATRGLRAPGLATPSRVKIGTWRGRRATRFVTVRRGEPALCLALHGQRYDTVLVSTPDAAALAAELQPPDGTSGHDPPPQRRAGVRPRACLVDLGVSGRSGCRS